MTDPDVQPELEEVRENARGVIGWDHLRPAQTEAIEAALSGHDVRW